MWEKAIDINEVREIRTRVNVWFGVGASAKISDIADDMRKRGIARVLVVTGKNAYKCVWDKVTAAFTAQGIEWVCYHDVTPNPTVEQVDAAAAIGRTFCAQAVLAIGGGSPIDAGKSVAILLKHTDKTASELFEYLFTATEAAPIAVINLTHGTGTEANRFAVVTVTDKEYKPAIAYDCIYPTWSIDDPALCTGLSADQTRYVSIDAVNHVVEAATTTVSSPYAVMLAKETIRLVGTFLPEALKDSQDLNARYQLMFAAMLGGVAFDNALLHYTHALEHPLSAVKPELSHGLGLAMLLPAVVKNIYPVKSLILADIFSPVVPGLTGHPDEALKAARGIEQWLKSVGVTQKLSDEGFAESDIEKLTDLAFTTPSLGMLLGLAPTEATRETVAQIYRDSLYSFSC